MLQTRHGFDVKQKDRLRAVVAKCKYVINNVVNFKMIEIENINSLIKELDDEKLINLMKGLEIGARERESFLVIERLW